MKRILPILIIPVLVFFLYAGNSFGYGMNITVGDGNYRDPRIGEGQGLEDQETEPGMVNTQVWDLEGFFVEGNQFTMVGGYDFSGKDEASTQWAPGDIFFDTMNGYNIGVTSTGNTTVANTFGWEYALRFDGSTFELFQAIQDSSVVTVYYGANASSNPWKMGDIGWEHVASLSGTYDTNRSDDVAGFIGGSHNVLSFTLPETFDFTYVHYTMQCGNDNMIGQKPSQDVPEPANIILLGTGLLGLAGIGRKKFFKK